MSFTETRCPASLKQVRELSDDGRPQHSVKNANARRSEIPGVGNIGWGEDVSIAELAEIVTQVVGFRGKLRYDTTKPDGTPRKLLDTSKLTRLGWNPRIRLSEGLADAYSWFRENVAERA